MFDQTGTVTYKSRLEAKSAQIKDIYVEFCDRK